MLPGTQYGPALAAPYHLTNYFKTEDSGKGEILIGRKPNTGRLSALHDDITNTLTALEKSIKVNDGIKKDW